MLIVIGVVVAFALLLAYVRATAWLKEQGKTRFAFQDRETHLVLKLERPLGDGQAALVAMQTLREALLLKLAGMSHGRMLIDASGLQLANARAFRLLIGGLSPVLTNEKVSLAVVSARRSRTSKHFRESGILTCLPSVREAERSLQSGQTPPRGPIDEALVNSLASGRRKAA